MADFYGSLLGMRRIFERPDGSVVALSNGTSFVTMMRTENYVGSDLARAWSVAADGHLDVSVTDLSDAVVNAVTLGAREADHQPKPDLFRVLFDPAGQLFCLATARLD